MPASPLLVVAQLGDVLYPTMASRSGVAFLAAVWMVLPAFAAAGKALDHPAWSDPTSGHGGGPPISDTTSWWPPGRRYEWLGGNPSRVYQAVDPWSSPWQGHLWTAVIAGIGILIVVVSMWSARSRGYAIVGGRAVNEVNAGGPTSRPKGDS